MSSSDRPSMPPVATLAMLAGDLLAASVEAMLRELAGAERWPAALRVRQCLDTYATARQGEILTDPDPQRVQINEPAPKTERSGNHA